MFFKPGETGFFCISFGGQFPPFPIWEEAMERKVCDLARLDAWSRPSTSKRFWTNKKPIHLYSIKLNAALFQNGDRRRKDAQDYTSERCVIITYQCWLWTQRVHWSLHSQLLSLLSHGRRMKSTDSSPWYQCFWQPFSQCDSCVHFGPTKGKRQKEEQINSALWTLELYQLPNLW